jgi:hypothetical protein
MLLALLATRALAGPALYVPGGFDQEGAASLGTHTEPSIAVGPNHVLSMIQGGIKVFLKTGPLVATYCPYEFFGIADNCANPTIVIDPFNYPDQIGCPSPPQPFTLHMTANDPTCGYDPFAKRYYALCFSQTNSQDTNTPYTTHIHLAISQTDNPTGPWTVYHMTTGSAACFGNYAVDRPRFGFSTDKIAIIGMHAGCPNTEFIRVFEKQTLLQGPVTLISHGTTHMDLSPAHYRDMPFPSALWQSVCRNLSATADLEFITVSGSNVSLATITGTGLANYAWGPVITANGVLQPPKGSSVAAVQKDGPGPGTLPIDAANMSAWQNALSDPYYRNGRIITSWHEGKTVGGNSVNVVRVLRVNATNGQVLSIDTQEDANKHFAYPTAIEDTLQNVYVGFDVSTATDYPGAMISGRKANEATLESPPTLIRGGETTFRKLNHSHVIPAWGDFTGIALDEPPGGAPAVAWYVGQFVHARNNDLQCQGDSLIGWIRNFTFPVGSGGGCRDCEIEPAPARTALLEVNSAVGRGEVRFDLQLSSSEAVTIEVLDLSGRMLRTLVAKQRLAAGAHQFRWDQRDASGQLVGNGMYFVRARTEVAAVARRFFIIR